MREIACFVAFAVIVACAAGLVALGGDMERIAIGRDCVSYGKTEIGGNWFECKLK